MGDGNALADQGDPQMKGAELLLSPAILWHIDRGDEPLLGLAVHAGHEMRPELIPHLAIDEVTRIREEDPITDYWALACGNRLLTRRSRFEVDLNRSRAEAICVQPEDCWNLTVWKDSIEGVLMERSLAEHDAFYETLDGILRDLADRFGRFIVLDVHSYNHRRSGPDSPPADPATHPEINLGTGSMDRERWSPVVDRFLRTLRGYDFLGRSLDVRENVRFRGRRVAEYVHQNYRQHACVLALEVKKFFMDEWTGVVDYRETRDLLTAFRGAMESAMKGLPDVAEG
jgi:N-formylglutamate amidohydrolase